MRHRRIEPTGLATSCCCVRSRAAWLSRFSVLDSATPDPGIQAIVDGVRTAHFFGPWCVADAQLWSLGVRIRLFIVGPIVPRLFLRAYRNERDATDTHAPRRTALVSSGDCSGSAWRRTTSTVERVRTLSFFVSAFCNLRCTICPRDGVSQSRTSLSMILAIASCPLHSQWPDCPHPSPRLAPRSLRHTERPLSLYTQRIRLMSKNRDSRKAFLGAALVSSLPRRYFASQ